MSIQGKHPVYSKTLWVNGLTVLVAALGAVAGEDVIKDYPQAVAGLGMAIGIVNAVLRYFFTTQPLVS